MQSEPLLPGVAGVATPSVVCDSRQAIKHARRVALVRDAGQLLVLDLVDWLFVHFSSMHIPMLNRQETIGVVVVVNLVIVGHVILSRRLPLWTARRIASTWNAAERARFDATLPPRAR